MLRRLLALGVLTSCSLALTATPSHAGAPVMALSPHPDGAAMVRLLGPQAVPTLAPGSGSIGALVAIPAGKSAASLGVDEIAPGIGRLRGDPARLEAFAAAHPDVHMEVSPPLHMLLDHVGAFTRASLARAQTGLDGKGVVVGVADTGIDITHPSLLDAQGKTRVAWMIDYSIPVTGKHPEVEAKFSIPDSKGNPATGAVFSSEDIDALIANPTQTGPVDEVGHGTHVTSIAAGTGSSRTFSGIAPGATLVVARVTRNNADAIENDDLLRGVSFLFDRADALGKPAVVNLSLGGDFGPHDGTLLWEKTLASFVGPDHPGRALVVAAGNSGSIIDTPVHESVRVTESTTMRVPVSTSGASAGGVQVWITLRPGAKLSIGLDGPDGTWISPVDEGNQVGKNQDGYNAGVIYGSSLPGSPIPADSRGAIVVWSGAWPSGVYWVTLQGEGTADLFLQTTGDAASSRPAGFAAGVREGTINLPATEPSLIAVGCTMNRPRWTSIAGGPVTLHVPALDSIGGKPASGNEVREPQDGEMCWFSSAGPTVTGVPKPEISAPGGAVAAAMSAGATPDKASSIFYDPRCPKVSDGQPPDPRCLQIDARQAIAVGTSMSAPAVAGAVALLLQRDPTLTQGSVTALLQAGAHPFRGAAPFEDQGGPGELDVVGALDALDQMKNPVLALPDAAKSWVTLGADYLAADDSTPLRAIVELRTKDGAHRADLFEPSRLHAAIALDGEPLPEPTMIRKGPGLYTFDVRVARGHGGSIVSVGATFDGAPIVAAKSVPVASDIWTASYGSHAHGGCSCSTVGTRAPHEEGDAPIGALAFAAGAVWLGAGQRRRRAARKVNGVTPA